VSKSLTDVVRMYVVIMGNSYWQYISVLKLLHRYAEIIN